MLKKIWEILNSPIGTHNPEDERLAVSVNATVKVFKWFYTLLGLISCGLVAFLIYAALL